MTVSPAPPPPESAPVVALVFAAVYLGMLLGRFPRLRLDRTGIALLGAIALLATGVTSLEEARAAVDLPTLALLFALMVVSAQLRLGGFYTRVTRSVAGMRGGPAALLAAVIAVTGGLAAVFSNDVICLAVAPVLIEACGARRLDPRPFLLGLACAANVGSAATLIGNPQNMLIGQTLRLSFAGYLSRAALPALLGLAAVWLVIVLATRGRWTRADAGGGTPERMPPFDAWQTAKGLGVAAALMAAFLLAPWPREVAALAGAGVLLTSRRLHSRDMLGYVDWQLLVLFVGLFVVNDAFARTGLPERAVDALARAGFDLGRTRWLLPATVVLSNVVSNVPAVMLLLPVAAGPAAGSVLALASTLGGNLLLVGSIANLIVADVAARRGIPIDWRDHARIGIPVTLVSLAIAAACLAR